MRFLEAEFDITPFAVLTVFTRGFTTTFDEEEREATGLRALFFAAFAACFLVMGPNTLGRCFWDFTISLRFEDE